MSTARLMVLPLSNFGAYHGRFAATKRAVFECDRRCALDCGGEDGNTAWVGGPFAPILSITSSYRGTGYVVE
jgi:hypothetical protein